MRHQDLIPQAYRGQSKVLFKDYSQTLKRQRTFWRHFNKDLIQHGPKVAPLEHPEGHNLEIGYSNSSDRVRPDYMFMSDASRHALKSSHTAYVDAIRNRQYSLPYTHGTRGIVTTAGGAYLNVALLSVRMLRQTGSILPVEIFLADWSEYDTDICGTIMPSLNASCVVLEDIFKPDLFTKKVEIEKYQFKVMAILFSSFEEVLFLDSDCFPVYDPNPLFDKRPFTDTGLVLWPDFWFPSESPLFFEIAGIAIPDIRTKPSTEAGEIMYSKRKHEHSILLATYYNFYGPNYYYPLQSQGAPGEGDKETFLWAAVAVNASYYAVKERVTALGYTDSAGGWRGSAMAQFDPVEDYTMDAKEVERATRYPRPAFLHVNFPKIDPGQIFIPNHLSFGVLTPTIDADGHLRRIWHNDPYKALAFFGKDVEKTMWQEVKSIACEYEHTFEAWRGIQDICKNATTYYDTVFYSS